MIPCSQEETIKKLVEAKGYSKAKLDNIEAMVKDIKDNHLKAIYRKLTRPSWTVCTIITSLVTIVGVLLTIVFT